MAIISNNVNNVYNAAVEKVLFNHKEHKKGTKYTKI